MKVRGFQVAPAELEGHLLDNPLVSDVCVVGVPDEYSGDLPFAFIVPSDDANEKIKRGEEKIVKEQIAKVRIIFFARFWRVTPPDGTRFS
jgi:acyl-CoA synthetase (AMP-forming)/AMP-acid ligase II